MIVIDNGSSTTKTGLSGEKAPQFIFPTVVARPKQKFIQSSETSTTAEPSKTPTILIGDEALANRSTHTLSRPIEFGIVTNWDYAEKLWNYSIRDLLKVDPKERVVVATEAPMTPKANRERATQIMFESFEASAFYPANQAVMSLFSVGKLTGLSVDLGEKQFEPVPVYEGYVIPHAVMRYHMSGGDLTSYMTKLVKERGMTVNTSADLAVVESMKKSCFVSLDYEAAIKQANLETSSISQSFTLPDGNSITIDLERFQAPEILFQPTLYSLEVPQLPEMIKYSIGRCDVDLRPELYDNVVLSGGHSMMNGLSERMKKELTKEAPAGTKVSVSTTPNGVTAAWTGASMVTSLSTFKDMCMNKDDYEECGPGLVHRMCF